MGWSGGSLARSKSRNGHRIAKELGITVGGDHTAPTNPRAHPRTKVQVPILKTQKMKGNKVKEVKTTGVRRGAVTPRMSDPKITIPTPGMGGMDIMGGRKTRTEMVMDHEAKEDGTEEGEEEEEEEREDTRGEGETIEEETGTAITEDKRM